eukprot:snap_masked-scaffold_2-processed-gene-4.42-mRNA-1 protein AED:1.00 eAED:1.00 QI:0/-1/0/0/-1/1/1/0/61
METKFYKVVRGHKYLGLTHPSVVMSDATARLTNAAVDKETPHVRYIKVLGTTLDSISTAIG